MAPAFVQGTTPTGGQTSPATAVFGSNTTAGSLLVFCLRMNTNANTLAITDTQNNSWVILPKATSGVDVYFAYALNTKGGANTVTATITSGAGMVTTAGEYSGVNSFRGSATAATGLSTTPTSNSFTATAGDLVIVSAGNQGGAVTTQGTGFTQREPGNGASAFAAFEDQIAAGGATSGSFTYGGSTNWVANLAAFFQAAASGSGWVNRHRSFANKR